MIAAQDGLDDHWIAKGVDIALSLQAGLVGVDAAGDVDGQDQGEVDFLLVLRRDRQDRDEGGEQTEQPAHHDLHLGTQVRGYACRDTRRRKKHTARRKRLSAMHWTATADGR